MSNTAVIDTSSKTSLFKAWWALMKKDGTKSLLFWTSVLNYAAMAAAIWVAIGPYFEARGASQASATVLQLQGDLANALAARDAALNVANANKQGYEAAQQDNSELAKANDELKKKLDTAIGGEGPAPTLQKATAEPPINKVKVRAYTAAKKKGEPSTCQQIEACRDFVAWYEKNVTPAAAP